MAMMLRFTDDADMVQFPLLAVALRLLLNSIHEACQARESAISQFRAAGPTGARTKVR